MYLQILFWLLVFCILHSYVIYPAILFWVSKGKEQNKLIYSVNDESLPDVAILMAVHNEEKVIAKKIESIYKCSYPLEKIAVYIGSDNSTDSTNEIIKKYQEIYPSLKLRVFERSGKILIINELEKDAKEKVLILTDANVFFEEETIYQLVKHYKNSSIALVGANIINQNLKKNGISHQEKFYLDWEKTTKYNQGVNWGIAIGVFGGCFSIRKENFTPVPNTFIVDDFYIAMKVLKQGKKVINELNAICYEDVSNKIQEEFRRKVRISIGNYQNLNEFKGLLWPIYKGTGYSFLSNKVLRWLTPFFIVTCLAINCFLLSDHPIYQITLLGQIAALTLPLIDWIFTKNQVNLKILRFVTHFYAMNLALLVGFFRYITGVKSSVWKPTERNQ